MCGFTGYWDTSGGELDEPLARMTAALVHRGPDDSGLWHDRQAGIALGHRRLSVLDLSPGGHQPMLSACDRYALVFNGEIYNHLHLRAALEQEGAAPRWRGHSDTETLLAAFARWGVREALVRTIGMFALALWDRHSHTLSLARDRMGEKPLYYGWQGDVFLFGSELKALRAHPAFHARVDRDSLCQLLRYNYVPAPRSIYERIFKLPPGVWGTLAPGAREPRLERYWSVSQAVDAGIKNPFAGSAEQAVDALESALGDAVARQMAADVPLGAFLSGGVDSSTVVALMQARSARPVKTFTIGFREAEYNEAQYAKAVAAHLGTDHTELYVSPGEALQVIPRLPSLYDEPFADSSQIPTFLVSQLARAQVTVSLSGDGGDELFGGYNRYLWSRRFWSKLSWMPPPARRALGRLLAAVAPRHWDAIYAMATPLLPGRLQVALFGDKLHKVADRLRSVSGADDLYYSLVSEWTHPAQVVIGGAERGYATGGEGIPPALSGIEERMMYLDSVTYLPDDILVKLDRAAMGVSLETRVPFLDHGVVEMAWRLPLGLKLRDGHGKWVLRQILHKHVPAHLIERPKQGFGVPLEQWLRGPLRDWAEALLDAGRLEREGYFHAGPIRRQWEQHLSGRRNGQFALWSVLMFQAWLESTR